MSTSSISWYSTDKNLAVVDRGVVTKEMAMKLIDDYFAKLQPRYESAEDAIAETTFGFNRSKDEFVELCLNGPTEISFRYEKSIPRKILFLSLPKVLQKERTLRSKDEVRAEISSLYDLDSVSYKHHVGV